MSTRIITTDWQTHSAELSEIRTRVFIEEQAVPEKDEWDEHDPNAVHFLVLTENNTAIGCARLLTERPADDQLIYHIGRVAILEPFRNRGLGHHLMIFILAYCRTQTSTRGIYLHAQITRRRFYETLGFIAQGEEFMDAGIPHIEMWLA